MACGHIHTPDERVFEPSGRGRLDRGQRAAPVGAGELRTHAVRDSRAGTSLQVRAVTQTAHMIGFGSRISVRRLRYDGESLA